MPSLRDSGKIIKIVGESVSIKELALGCPGLPPLGPLSLRWLISALMCPFPVYIRLHIKLLTPALMSYLDAMVEAMRIVYATAGIRVELASRERLNFVADPILATLTDLDVGNCGANVTPEQDLLFLYRNNVGDDEIVVYFVDTIGSSRAGCATHPNNKPGAVVEIGAGEWVLAHEVGHVLGLNHISGEGGDDCDTPDFTRLMTGCGDSFIGTPTLSEDEIDKMNRSNLVVAG